MNHRAALGTVAGLWLCLLAFVGPQARAADRVPTVEEFVKAGGDAGGGSLSPDGRYIAIQLLGTLVVVEVSNRRFVTNLEGGVWSYGWDGPDRIVGLRYWSQDTAAGGDQTAEMVALDVSSDSRHTLGRASQLLNSSPRVPGEVLVLYQKDEDAPEQILSVDTSTGERTLVATSPGDAKESFAYLSDSQGRLRYMWKPDFSTSTEGQLFKFHADAGQPGRWERTSDTADRHVTPVFITADGRTTYAVVEQPTARAGVGRFCLERWTDAPPATPSREPETTVLFCQDRAAILSVLKSSDESEAIATFSEDGPPRLKIISDHPDADFLAEFQKSLGGDLVLPVSASTDGRIWLLYATGSTNLGTYYVFDRKTRGIEELVRTAEKLPTGALRPTRPLRITTRDGLTVDAYLTLPAPAPDKRPPPLVLIPHGGPVYIRDDGRYEMETQLLATRGYAVLTVNFRGSSGYGLSFQQAGKGQWGTGMIDDLLDSVHHVLEKKLVDPSRVAVYGGSYGGYAALMCAIREPDLFKAVVTLAGPTDLNRLKADDDTGRTAYGREYQKIYWGEDAATLREQSPITHLDRLKAPVFIAHGMQDERVPISQAELLRDALKERHHPFKWLVRGAAAHGFSTYEESIDFYERMLDFLKKNVMDIPASPAAAKS